MEFPTQTTLTKIIDDLYQAGCHYLKIIFFRPVIFKGFYHQKLFQEIIAKQEDLLNVKVSRDIFLEYVNNLPYLTAGNAWPFQTETWIAFHHFYLQQTKHFEIDHFLDTLVHEIAHAVLYNLDDEEGHSPRYQELTSYLKNCYTKRYSQQTMLKIFNNYESS